MGEPVRRLRPLLPQQADRGGDRQALLHRRRLPAARRRELPLQGLQEPRRQGGRLRHADDRNINRINWLPPTCGYKLVAAGKDLYWWHPLVSGDPETVHQAGVSIRGKMSATEKTVPDDKLDEYIVSWPMKWPKGSRG